MISLQVCQDFGLLLYREELRQWDKSWLTNTEIEEWVDAWVKVFRIIPEFTILSPTFHRKSATKSWMKQILIAFFIYIQFIYRHLKLLMFVGILQVLR